MLFSGFSSRLMWFYALDPVHYADSVFCNEIIMLLQMLGQNACYSTETAH